MTVEAMQDGIWGDVLLDPSVAIAPNVLLFADPPARIEIGPGVCIGAGSIIHAWGGVLHIGAGALLGTATLLVGSGKIGTHACVGAMSTVVNPDIEDGRVIPASSYFGEDSVFSPQEIKVSEQGTLGTGFHAGLESPHADGNPAPMPSSHLGSPDTHPANGKPVYGIEAFYRLMAMLFPHREAVGAPLPSAPLPSAPVRPLEASTPSSSDRHGDAL